MEKTNPKIQNLILKLEDENGIEREKAREKLVAIGKESIPYLMDLTDSPKHILRWESVKALSEMEDKSLIPLFLNKLMQDESGIRWIAAEALSNIGSSVLVPLMKTIQDNADSVFLLSGAHHIIYNLMINENIPDNFDAKKILPLLKSTTPAETTKAAIYKALKEIK